MSAMRWAVGVDVGGTRISAGLVCETGELAALKRRATPRAAGAEATAQQLAGLLHEVLTEAADRDIVGIGVGFGGPVDHAEQQIRRSHHATGWAGIKLGEVLSEEFGLPAFLENDANAGGLGEALFGAGRGLRDLLYVNVGTGVGGAVIIGGRLHRGANSNAGELGHVVLDPDGPQCTCGKRGCVETLCSGEAIGRMAREHSRSGSALADIPEPELSGKTVGELALRGDRLAAEIVKEAASNLGWALAAAVNLLDPEAVVLGGGVPEMGETYLEAVRSAFASYVMEGPAERTRILPAELGYNAGVIGAGAVALRESGVLP